MKAKKRAAGIATAMLLVAGAASAQVLTRDHLQCFKIKDSTPKALYTADLASDNAALPPVQPGCTIKMPAKQWCVNVAKTNVAPAPAGAAPGESAQQYLCYKTKCPKLKPQAQGTDQFGVHEFSVKKTALVCAPIVSGCDQNETLCGGQCVDTATDEANCGACSEACTGDQSCVTGECTLVCPLGELACGETACCNAVTEFCNSGVCEAIP